jgi:hypothetical protein
MDTFARQKVRGLAVGLVLLSLFVAASPSPARAAPVVKADAALTPDSVVRSWPLFSRAAARAMLAKYGKPSQYDRHALVWFNNGNWRRTVVYRVPVRFPGRARGRDVIQQTIAYLVPVSKAAALKKFSPRLEVNAAAGEVTFTSDSEAKNLLAVNLTDEIVVGKRSVVDAQKFFSRTTRLASSGKSSSFMESLRFDVDNSRYLAPTGADR